MEKMGFRAFLLHQAVTLTMSGNQSVKQGLFEFLDALKKTA